MNKKSFTLIELIIVMALFSVLVVSALWVFVVGLRVWGTNRDRNEIRSESSLAMERITRELSQASSITNADEDAITFMADLDDDGSNETVTFSTDSNRLIRTEAATETSLAFNVEDFALAYRDADNDLMNLPADVASQAKRDLIRVIIISLAMNKGEESFTLSSSVYARNQ